MREVCGFLIIINVTNFTSFLLRIQASLLIIAGVKNLEVICATSPVAVIAIWVGTPSRWSARGIH
jgi:hypothetical protein